MSELHSFLSKVLKIFITICKYTDLKSSKDILFSLIFLPYRRLSHDISGDVVSFRDYIGYFPLLVFGKSLKKNNYVVYFREYNWLRYVLKINPIFVKAFTFTPVSLPNSRTVQFEH